MAGEGSLATAGDSFIEGDCIAGEGPLMDPCRAGEASLDGCLAGEGLLMELAGEEPLKEP